MRKFLILIMGMCISFILVACNTQDKNYVKSVDKSDTVNFGFRDSVNTERLDKFVDNVDKKVVDRVNLVRTTTEGDPIITQLYYNGKDIIISMDNSQDKFAGTGRYEIYTQTINGTKNDLVKYLEDTAFYPKKSQ